MTSPWWAAFGDAETSVSCGAGQHRLRWAEGALDAVDHPDADGELVIAALGGAATPCLDLVRAWGRHRDNLSVLAVGPRSADDQLTIGPDAIEDLVSPTRHGRGLLSSPAARRAATLAKAPRPGARAAAVMHSRAALSPAQRPSAPPASVPPSGSPSAGPFRSSFSIRSSVMSARSSPGGAHADPGARLLTEHAELSALMALGQPFQFRLSGAVAHAWSADGQRSAQAEEAAPALTAALSGRLAPAAAQWLGIDAGDVRADIHEGTGWGEIELIRSAGARTLHAELPLSWLATVWAPGLAVAGHLVVSVQQAAWPTAQVLALRQPGGRPVEFTVRRGDAGWSVAD